MVNLVIQLRRLRRLGSTDDQVRTAPSAGRGCTVDGEADRALVESVVEVIEPVDVTGETATMDDAVEQRLQELGYMT